jgi:hypothetical protein
MPRVRNLSPEKHTLRKKQQAKILAQQAKAEAEKDRLRAEKKALRVEFESEFKGHLESLEKGRNTQVMSALEFLMKEINDSAISLTLFADLIGPASDDKYAKEDRDALIAMITQIASSHLASPKPQWVRHRIEMDNFERQASGKKFNDIDAA